MYGIYKPPIPSDEKKEDKNLSVSIYEDIKAQIISGKLAPGAILIERTIAVEFGVSRTPVREALKRLSQEGWINWEERRRAVVSEINEKDVIELFLIREMIEPFAVRRIIEIGEPQLLAGMLVTIVKEMEELRDSHTEFMRLDMIFHSTIVIFAGIEKLTQMWQKIGDEMMRLAIFAIHGKRRSEEIIEEHKNIIDAFWNSDLKLALKCVKKHHSNILTAYKVKQDLNKDQKD